MKNVFKISICVAMICLLILCLGVVFVNDYVVRENRNVLVEISSEKSVLFNAENSSGKSEDMLLNIKNENAINAFVADTEDEESFMKYICWYIFGLLGIVNLILGIVFAFFKVPMNNWCGYRSKRSMKSEDAWQYSSKIMGRLMLLLTVIFLSCAIALIMCNVHFGITMGVIIGVELVGMIIIAITIECLLARKERKEESEISEKGIEDEK